MIANRAEFPCSLFSVLRRVPHTYLSCTYVEPSSVICYDLLFSEFYFHLALVSLPYWGELLEPSEGYIIILILVLCSCFLLIFVVR